MKKYLLPIFFCSILLFAAWIRLYLISDIPPGINRDEGSIGYTAYSLLTTGKDEYGRAFPFSFESFGDWKLPLYIYVTTVFVWANGLNELSIRLPSALFGIATVALSFFLAKEMFKSQKVALLCMVFVAIAPWHIHLSRVESEANTAVFFATLGYLLLLKSFHKKAWLLVLSALAFALTYYTYAGNHVFTTLLIVGIILFYFQELKQNKWHLVAGGVFLLLFSVIVYFTLFQASKTKLSGIGIFGDPAVVHARIELPRIEHTNPQSYFARIVHNRVVFAMERIGQNYLMSFSPQFLFISGGENKAHNIENFGNMYLIEAPFLILGLFGLFVAKKTKEKKLLLWWFFIAPVAASITKDAPHTNRMFAIFPMLPFVTAYGCAYFFEWYKKYIPRISFVRPIILVSIVCLFLLNIGIYVDRYFVHFPKDEAQNWGIGYKQLAQVLRTNDYKNKKVIITHPEYSPYIFLLYYMQYDPSKYQEEALIYPYTNDGFAHVKGFNRFSFREIDWEKDTKLSDTLLVDFSAKVPLNIAERYTTQQVSLPNGLPQFTIIETK